MRREQNAIRGSLGYASLTQPTHLSYRITTRHILLASLQPAKGVLRGLQHLDDSSEDTRARLRPRHDQFLNEQVMVCCAQRTRAGKTRYAQ